MTPTDDVSTLKPEEVRRTVSDAYARAVAKPGTGCCGSGTGSTEAKGALAKFATYDRTELDALPADAVENAFGCGNPVAFTGVREGDVVLDLGSGAGIDLLLASRKVGPDGRVIGVDMTDAMIDKARTNIARAGATNVEVRKGIIEALPVDSGSVDWVISNCVINLSPEKDRVFAEIARVLKPGGRMLVSDLVVEDLPEWVRRDPALYSSCIAGAVSEKEYLEAVSRAGLADVEVKDRVVYDAAHLESFVESEIESPEDARVPASPESSCGCGSGSIAGAPCGVTEELAGKVRSLMVYARKA